MLQFGPFGYIWDNISETVHATTNVCVKYIYDIRSHLTCDDFKGKINSQIFAKRLYLINGDWYDTSLYETHIVDHL